MTNTSPLPTTETSYDLIEHISPDPKVSSSEALLIALQAWVLRLMADPKSKPGQVLNALRRLETMKEFPSRLEKLTRTLALAEARVDLRRRALDLREAQLKERQEKREMAAEKAAAKITRAAAKAQPTAAAPVPVSSPLKKAPIASTQTIEMGVSPQKDWARMPLTNKAFGPLLAEQLGKTVLG